MPRYRAPHKRSEEEKRNLKVDPKRIPEWEAEIDSIRARFQRFNLAQIASAATLIQEMRHKLHYILDHQRDKDIFETWKKRLTVDSLVDVSSDYSAPEFVQYGVREDIVGTIRSELAGAQRQLAEDQAKGVTDSVWESMFTGKVSLDHLKSLEERKRRYLSYSREIPNIIDALRLLDEVRSTSREYASRISKLRERLWLAKEKQGAIDRFEAKHGKAFAKAAAVDNKTRCRATSLKRLVNKTNNCPYCGSILGTNPHLDHIYPVSKGGLSIVENLVWCCSSCNAAKTDKGLVQFLTERGLSIERALSQLHSLGKHV